MERSAQVEPRQRVQIAVRRAEETDVPQLVQFNERLALETEGRQLNPTRLARGVMGALRAPARARYYVAEVERQAVGQAMITYEWSDWRNGVFWWLQSVYVDVRWRRRGVFRALYATIRAEAERAPDACGLRLYVEQENHAAIGVYRALGMSPCGYHLYELDWSK